MGPQPHEMPVRLTSASAKFYFRRKRGTRLFRQQLFSPIFSASGFFGFLAQGIGLFLVFAFFNSKKTFEASTKFVVGVVAFFAAIGCWAILQLVATPFRHLREERRCGKWHGDRFVYTQPQHLLTKEWTPVDNGNLEYFDVPDVPPDALVSYKIEIEGSAERVNCVLLGAYYFSPVAQMFENARFAQHGKVRLRKDGNLLLHCLVLPNTVPAVIRVSMLAWEIDNSTLLDYTDTKSETRIVLRPPT